MIVSCAPDVHLGYCTNIHPGETWPEVFRNIDTHVRAVKGRACPSAPFGMGLRLSAAAAAALADPSALADLRRYLADSGLYVFTVNGFPYGPFHGAPVKERVYLPDWLDDERLAYSDRLAAVLAGLLPPDLVDEGTISTVPGCFKRQGALTTVAPAIANRLIRHAATLWRAREAGGPPIALALEPEPECVLETTADGVAFLERFVFATAGVDQARGLTGLGRTDAEAMLRQHLGLCLDACHAAVEFETPADAVRLAEKRGVRILKMQVSAGLRIPRPDPQALAALAPFAEGVYLHQVVVRRGETLERHLDLPAALSAASHAPGDEWRVHFHVPLFRQRLGAFEGTQPFVAELLALQARRPFTRHLEVETYTWDVLPAEHRREPVDEAIAREIAWARSALEGRP